MIDQRFLPGDLVRSYLKPGSVGLVLNQRYNIPWDYHDVSVLWTRQNRSTEVTRMALVDVAHIATCDGRAFDNRAYDDNDVTW